MENSIYLEYLWKSKKEKLQHKIVFLTKCIDTDYRILCDLKKHGISSTNKIYHAIYCSFRYNKNLRAKIHEKLKAMG